jgi:predicted PurR-regulated permease PerM
MRNIDGNQPRGGERGAVKISTVLLVLFLLALTFAVIKVVPVYTEERQLTHEIDELARISAVRNYKVDQIEKGIEKLRSEYNLPENSITLMSHAQNQVQIDLKYSKVINLLVTTFDWKVEHSAKGRAF